MLPAPQRTTMFHFSRGAVYEDEAGLALNLTGAASAGFSGA
jgi:hypothetical protein